MSHRLLVKEPFGDYAFGDRITKAAEMAAVVKSHPDHVLREDVPAKAKPKRKAAKAKAKPAAKAPVAAVEPAPKPAARTPMVTRNVTINDTPTGGNGE